MNITPQFTPTVTHRRPSPGEPKEPILIDAETGAELLVVPPRFGSASRSKRRYHHPDLDAHPAIEPACEVKKRTEESWQYRKREVVEKQADSCQYCAGEITRSEISKKGGARMGSLVDALDKMSIEEFDALSETPTPHGGPADD